MNENYISGFFDADGSITMAKNKKTDKFKTLKIDLVNTDLKILLAIKEFMLERYDIPMALTHKKAKKDNHSDSYCLSLSSNQRVIQLCEIITSFHSKKTHRINTVLKYHNKVTKRNGKYTEQQYARKLAYERLFFFSNFH